MRIESVITHVLKAPLDRPFFFSQAGEVTQRAAVVVEIATDSGIVGFGEALCHGLQPPEVAASVIDGCLKELLVGQDALSPTVMYSRLYNRTKDFGQKGAVIGAISAVDIALWDILGKHLGAPVWQLLGGAHRKHIGCYATGFYRVSAGEYPQLLVDEAQTHLEDGFDAMKVKIGFGIDEDIETMAQIRAAVGPTVTLMADANHAYATPVARRLLSQLEPYNVFWIEEPVSPEDVDGYAELRRLGGPSLIAAGENEFTALGYWPWVRARAIDILQPDIAASGGFTGLRDILALATSAQLLFNPHVWGTAIGLVASLHLLATVPPQPLSRGGFEPLLEYDRSDHPFRTELVVGAPFARRGQVGVPDGPGLGIEINRDCLEKWGTGGISDREVR